MLPARTSLTDPIRVDWLPARARGRIGLTFAPGKQAPSFQGPPWRRDLALDLERLRQTYSVRALVCLLEDHELVSLGIPALVVEAEVRGLEVLRLPIPDGGVPSLLTARALVERIVAEAQRGHDVAIHCRGGIGRTGTIGGCVLVQQGVELAEALRFLRIARGEHCPENDLQRGFVGDFARTVAST